MATNVSLAAKRLRPREIASFFRKDLRRVVSIHTAMFQKLLFQEEELPLELADLFEDVGNRYLDISEQISALHRSRRKATD
jgi:hypothetical protein